MKTSAFPLLIALFILVVGSASAQTPDFTLGVKAGMNYGFLPTKFKEISNERGKAGFNVGVFARAGERLYFQPEVNYSTFGSKYTIASRTYQPTFKQLNVPLMIGYKLITTDRMNLRISAGPDLSYNLNKPQAPEGYAYRKMNVGVVQNIGVDIGNVALDLRSSQSLTKFNKNLGERAVLVSLSVGYKFL